MTPEQTRRAILACAVSTGSVALFTQAVLFRELSIILRSNDLIVGIVLALWLFSAGIGSILSPFGTRWFRSYFAQTSAAFVSLIILQFAANLLNPGFGQIWPFLKTILLILLSVAPTAMTTGAAFAAFSASFRRYGDPARVYIHEGLGSLIGGVLSLILAALLPPQVSISIITGASFGGIFVFTARTRRGLISALAFIAAFLTIPAMNSIERTIENRLYSGYEVERFESVHGAIQVMSRFDETYLFQGGAYLGSTSDTVDSAPLIHALLATAPPKSNYLIIGGILQGNISAVMAHQPEKIAVIVNDQKLLEKGARSFPAFRKLADPQIEIIIGDPARELRKLKGNFDYILIFPGIPQSAGDGRLITERVFENLATHLSPEGKLFVGFPTAPNIITDDEAALLASVRMAIAPFGDVTAYFGENTALLAFPDSGEFGRKLQSLEPSQVEHLPIPYSVLTTIFEDFRQEDFRRRIETASEQKGYKIEANSWAKPFALFLGLRRWEKLAGGRLLSVFAAIPHVIWYLSFFFILTFSTSTARSGKFEKFRLFLLAFTAGAFGMGSSIWLMYYFQVVGGQLYLAIGLLSALFIVGTIGGASLVTSGKIRFRGWLIVYIAVGISLVATALSALPDFPIWLAIFIFGFYHFLIGSVVGALYPLLLYIADERGIFRNKAPAVIYSADLVGSAIAAPLFGVLLIPVFGMEEAFLFIVIIYFAFFNASRFNKKENKSKG
jgi:predicted membrane-bound spermidine synthase